MFFYNLISRSFDFTLMTAPTARSRAQCQGTLIAQFVRSKATGSYNFDLRHLPGIQYDYSIRKRIQQGNNHITGRVGKPRQLNFINALRVTCHSSHYHASQSFDRQNGVYLFAYVFDYTHSVPASEYSWPPVQSILPNHEMQAFHSKPYCNPKQTS